MPKNVDIFVGSEAPIKTFVKEMETLLGIKLHAISDGEEIFYEFRDLQIVLTVGTHDFVNDRDMNFEDYRYDLSVRALNVSTEEHRKKWRDKFCASSSKN